MKDLEVPPDGTADLGSASAFVFERKPAELELRTRPIVMRLYALVDGYQHIPDVEAMNGHRCTVDDELPVVEIAWRTIVRFGGKEISIMTANAVGIPFDKFARNGGNIFNKNYSHIT